ncbi:nuclear transport factor 2 family protein [Streptomyces sp. NPDC001492]
MRPYTAGHQGQRAQGVASQRTELIGRACRAFAEGDIPAVLELFDPDVTWHVPGHSPLSGDYPGPDGVLKGSGLCLDLSGGTLKVQADEILADGERVVVLSEVSAERHGKSWSCPEVHVWRVVAGKDRGVPRVPG